MTSQQHDDPAADAAARTAQLAAMVLSIGEAVARLHAERLAARAAEDERHAAAARAQVRADRAAGWLALPAGARSTSGAGPAPGPEPPERREAGPAGPVSVTIVCAPQDLVGQAFPVPMAEAMATAPQAARDAVRLAPTTPARLASSRPQLTAGSGTGSSSPAGPRPGSGGGGRS